MTTQYTYTAAQLEALAAKGARELVVCAYNIGEWERGDVKSWHKSYDRAAVAAKGQFFGILNINEAIGETRMREESAAENTVA